MIYDYESGPRCYGFGSRIMPLGLRIGTVLLGIRIWNYVFRVGSRNIYDLEPYFYSSDSDSEFGFGATLLQGIIWIRIDTVSGFRFGATLSQAIIWS